MPEQAFATVKVKRGHPTGEYRRGGHVFYAAEPVTIQVEDVTSEMAADSWLVIALDPDATTASLEVMKRDTIDALASSQGIDTTDAKNKGEAIERIKAATKPAPPVEDPASLASLQSEIESLQGQLLAMTEERDNIQHKEISAAQTELEAMRNRAIAAETERDAALAEVAGLTPSATQDNKKGDGES